MRVRGTRIPEAVKAFERSLRLRPNYDPTRQEPAATLATPAGRAGAQR